MGIMMVFVARDWVERGVAGDLGEFLGNLADNRLSLGLMQSVFIGFDGYDDDHRELYEISEVLEWYRRFLAEWPSMLFFLSVGEGHSYRLLSLFEGGAARHSSGKAVVNLEKIADWFSHKSAQHFEWCRKMGVSEREAVRIATEASQAVSFYYSQS